MQQVNGHAESYSQIQFVNETENIMTGHGDYSSGLKRTGDEAGLESDSESEHPPGHVSGQSPVGPKAGKKTRGRVKIEMRFIENKLRRYTTFSKRKTGIMKKVYYNLHAVLFEYQAVLCIFIYKLTF